MIFNGIGANNAPCGLEEGAISIYLHIRIVVPCKTAAKVKTAPPISAPRPMSLVLMPMLAPTIIPESAVIKMNSETPHRSTSNATTNDVAH